MLTRSRLWLAAAVIFTIVNLAGAGYAAAMGDALHLATHVVLLLPGLYFVRRFARSGARSVGSERVGSGGESPQLDDRLSRLEQAVDAVGIEVERMGDGQRLMTQMVAEASPSKTSAEPA